MAAADQLLTAGVPVLVVYGGTSHGSFTPESLSRDFRELGPRG
jgi:hypothetical protein